MLKRLLRLADGARHRARRRRWSADQVAGRRGEDLAHRFLEQAGLTVVARNYRTPSGHGEVDLIGWDGEALVFIEVKSRFSEEHSAPDRNVDLDKERALVAAARYYAHQAGVPWERVRFDLVSVLLTDPPSLRHRKDSIRVAAGL